MIALAPSHITILRKCSLHLWTPPVGIHAAAAWFPGVRIIRLAHLESIEVKVSGAPRVVALVFIQISVARDIGRVAILPPCGPRHAAALCPGLLHTRRVKPKISGRRARAFVFAAVAEPPKFVLFPAVWTKSRKILIVQPDTAFATPMYVAGILNLSDGGRIFELWLDIFLAS